MVRGDLSEREERALGAAVAQDRQQQVDASLDAALEAPAVAVVPVPLRKIAA